MRRLVFLPYESQALRCAGIALVALVLGIGLLAHQAFDRWDTLRVANLLWEGGEMQRVCDERWARFISLPLGTESCDRKLRPADLDSLEAWYACTKSLKEERESLHASLLSSGCAAYEGRFDAFSLRGESLKRVEHPNPGSLRDFMSASVGARLPETIGVSLAVGLGAFILLQVGRLLLSEPNAGWRRASVVAAAFAAVAALVYPLWRIHALIESVGFPDAVRAAPVAVSVGVATLVVLLLGLRVQRWVSAGFASSRSGEPPP